MNASILLRISIRSLTKHKGRSFLTVLGIIIGISSIIATLAIGKGAEEKAKQKILSMGNNYIEIYSGNWLQEGKTAAKKRRRFQWLQNKDVDVIKKLCPSINVISPSFGRKELITYRGNSVFVKVKGGNESFLKVLGRKLKSGMFFNKNQSDKGARVIVLGSKTASELFKTLNPIGQTVKIKNMPFTVIGVMEKMENYHGIRDPNLETIVPIKSVKRYVARRFDNSVETIVISAPTKKDIPRLVKKIKRIMRFRRKIKANETDNFMVVDQETIMKVAKGAASTIRLLLLIIASISLLVGGIGIMNIMLVSVTERTKEIGIRMALGANSKVILNQFLAEAITLCIIGGTIGIMLGIAAPYVVAYFTKWNPIVTTSSILVAVIITSAIGIFFGYYPAKKASKMNPVEALAER